MSAFGLNILQMQRNAGNLTGALERLKPRWNVVQDEHKLAVALDATGYGTIYRAKRDRDNEYHTWMSPERFIGEHRPLATGRIVLQCLNEPVVQVNRGEQGALIDFEASVALCKPFSAWLLRVIELANAAGIRLCAPNFAMGNPHESLIEAGVFDDVLRAIVSGGHILGLHEYAKRGNVVEGWLIGRYWHWLHRADVLGIKRPTIVITECGYDIGGGEGDGWSRHIGAAQYGALLKVIGRIYREQDIPACIFSWGDGFGWRAFNIEGEGAIMDAMAEVNAQAAAPEPRWERRRIVLAGEWCNLREQPSIGAPATRFEGNGTVIEWAANRDTADADKPALRWQMVRIDGRVGWVRSDAATLAILDIPSPPPPDGEPKPGSVTITLPESLLENREQALLMAALFEGYADAIRAQVNR